MSRLDLHNLGKDYGRVHALQGVSLTVAAGSSTAIIGPSGSGKTTLLRLIAGFEAPTTGHISLGGQMIADQRRALPAYRRDIGLVAQDGALFPHLTVADNIGFGLDRKHPGRAERIASLLETVELPQSFGQRLPHELSGGQQQRVALARALARQPKLMLLDEPFSALDTGLRAALRKAVAAILNAAGMTTILVTHDQEEALSFADQIAVLRQGRLVQAGAPHDLYRAPCNPETAFMLGPAVILPARLTGTFGECALGPVAITGPARHGMGQIMLRPEQIELTVVRDTGAIPPDGYGRVAELDYGGGVSVITLDVRDDQAATTRLVVRTAALDPPAPGSLVRMAVHGAAHVF